MHSLRPTRIVIAVAAAAALALTGCSSQPSSGTGASGGGGEGSYTSADIEQATNGRVETPLYAVPKSHDRYTFAFLNPGLTIPSFVDWQNGIRAAADFYGVDVLESDIALDQSKALSLYQTLAVKNPTVVGSGAGQAPPVLIKQLATDQLPAVMIDQEPAAGEDFKWFGVDNSEVGKAGAEQLGEAAKAKVAADWAGQDVAYLGVSVSGCAPCDGRVKAGGDVVKSALGLADSNVLFLSPSDGSAAGEQAAATDFLTAHPNSKIVSLAYGDGGAVGVLKALAQAGRLDDALVVSLGGDPSGRAAMRDPANANAFVGAVDFNPWAEGWNWVEAAIAVQNGESFEKYQTSRFLTPSNVDQFYPEDNK